MYEVYPHGKGKGGSKYFKKKTTAMKYAKKKPKAQIYKLTKLR